MRERSREPNRIRSDGPHVLLLQWLVRRPWSLRTAAMAIVVSTLLIASVIKFTDLSVFADSVRTWSFVPIVARPLLVISVPAIEMLVALAWILGVHRRLAALVTVILLFVFTVALSVQMTLGAPPNCGCLGKWASYYDAQDAARFGLARNVLLLAIGLFGLEVDRSVKMLIRR